MLVGSRLPDGTAASFRNTHLPALSDEAFRVFAVTSCSLHLPPDKPCSTTESKKVFLVDL
ncbi:hypothetical protein KTH_27290 [Thermosporothrix hazakensis]|uniref:Uncharacterized protein n=1 Tax=Thermosporothrix sp. COM3 TaxID=2490863 RepID=A0A455SX22_9CHLR|nr:hypothetical protein KTC_44250 [Thermosporothrix sp. COM3]GCE47860.1 hypothetical protein KTH_27290 [Thermosporothrix hazakensis]